MKITKPIFKVIIAGGRDSDCLYLEKVRNELDNIFKGHKNLFKND